MSSRIRVVFVIPDLVRGGAERQVLALLRSLDRSRFEATLVLFENRQSTDSYDIQDALDRVLTLGITAGGNSSIRRAPALLLGARRLAVILRDLRADVLHTFLPAPAMVGSIAARMARVPVFIVGRRSMTSFYSRKNRLLSLLDRIPIRLADAVVGNCEAITAEAITVGGVNPSRAFTVYNGIDTNLFHHGEELALRHQFGFTPDDVVFGTIANLDASKRHIDLVRSAYKLRSKSPSAKFLVIGADRGQLQTLRSEVRSLRMEQSFVIHPATREPERIYRMLDIYVCASETEGMSNSILEAMASAKPVIATAVGGNPELVVPGITGFLVPPRLPEAIATCAETLCRDAILRAQMGRSARRMAVEQFSISAMTSASAELYSKLLTEARTGAMSGGCGEADSISHARK
jgi:glycosyltransferase involved in cell wall biosynthesis